MSNEASMLEYFGKPIFVYTRAQAIEDGWLIDVTETAREAGFRVPVAVTQAVWEECVAWTDTDSERQTYQDEAGRLWDVLWMAMMAIRRSAKGSKASFQLYCVPRDGKATEPTLKTLELLAGPGDDGEMVITILVPGED